MAKLAIKSETAKQKRFFPIDIEELIPQTHIVRVVDTIIDHLDISEIIGTSSSVTRTQPIVCNHSHIRDESKKRVMRLTPRTFRIVSFGCPFLTALTNHHCRVEIKSVVVEKHFRKEPIEQIAEHALIDGLRKFVEISLVSPMVCTAFPTEQIT